MSIPIQRMWKITFILNGVEQNDVYAILDDVDSDDESRNEAIIVFRRLNKNAFVVKIEPFYMDPIH